LKKIIFPFFILFILASSSCGNKTGQSENKKKDSVVPPIFLETTEYHFDFPSLPAGYYFDTISFEDSATRWQFDFYFPQCSLAGKEKFNAAIKAALKSQADLEINYTKDYPFDGPMDPWFTMVIGPSTFYSDDRYLSVCFVKDQYGWGGNHHNYFWYTFNYDFKNEKPIWFRDVFRMNTRRDSVRFAKRIERNCVDDQGNQYGMAEIYMPYDSIDFSIVAKGMYLNPDLDWADGMKTAFLSDDSLKPFLKWKRNK
jgi:hypothetical protein